MHIFFLPSGSRSYLKDNVHGGRRIDRLSVSLRRFETNLLSGASRILIKSVTEAADHIQYTHFTAGCKKNANKDLAFQFHLARVFGVIRLRLE